MTKAQALKALLVAVGANPRKVDLDSVTVVGDGVGWEETCKRSMRAGVRSCMHYRSSLAPRDAVDALMEAVGAE